MRLVSPPARVASRGLLFRSRLAFCAAFLLPLLAGSPHAAAQSSAIAVEVVLDEKDFLPGEELPVGVRISNLTGRPVAFGTTTNWLTFFVETKSGEVVTRLGPVPVLGEFTLDSAKAGTKWWNIQPYFGFDRTGPHHVYAEIRLPEWNQTLVSDPVTFNIQGSSRLWEMTFGVPPADGTSHETPELRRYALQVATRSKERMLYARVSDDSNSRILRVVALDRYLSFANPRQQLDSRSRLHVLFQTGGTQYTYCIISPDGELVGREQHEIAATRPRLVKQADGSIAVAGGRRRPTLGDIPPYVPPPPTVSTNTPTATNTAPADAKAPEKAGKRRRRGAEPKSDAPDRR